MTTLTYQNQYPKEQLPSDGRPFARYLLRDLADQIVRSSDNKALMELHDFRRAFEFNGGNRLLLAQYLEHLRLSYETDRVYGSDSELYSRAYDLTIDKFTNLPSQEDRKSDDPKGPDSRYYFRAFVEFVDQYGSDLHGRSPIELEYIVSRMLQRHVTRHFKLSCLECKRRMQKLTRRYIWKIDGRSLSVWLPFEISGRYCKSWLKEHIPDIDPNRVGEQERVQMIVDGLLVRRRFVSYEDTFSLPGNIPISYSPVEQATVDQGLAEAIAQEKAETIDVQRPAIKRLGPTRLKQMILETCSSLAEDHFEAAVIAQKYGISNSTFSRFAGLRWSTQPDDNGVFIPDLWRNMAHILAQSCDFVEAARQAGVWPKVARIIGREAGESNE